MGQARMARPQLGLGQARMAGPELRLGQARSCKYIIYLVTFIASVNEDFPVSTLVFYLNHRWRCHTFHGVVAKDTLYNLW